MIENKQTKNTHLWRAPFANAQWSQSCAGFIRSARERRDMPIIQHIPCPTSSNSRLQTKHCSDMFAPRVVGTKLESTASRFQRPPVKRQAADKANNLHQQAATKEARLLRCHGHTFTPIVSRALVVFRCKLLLGWHLHHR